MTRVCVRCGWLVLDGTRCRRDGGPTLKWQSAARACRVETLRGLLHLSPSDRALGFIDAANRYREARPT